MPDVQRAATIGNMYYQPPPNEAPNIFGNMVSQFLAQRNQWALPLFKARLAAMDPAARAEALMKAADIDLQYAKLATRRYESENNMFDAIVGARSRVRSAELRMMGDIGSAEAIAQGQTEAAKIGVRGQEIRSRIPNRNGSAAWERVRNVILQALQRDNPVGVPGPNVLADLSQSIQTLVDEFPWSQDDTDQEDLVRYKAAELMRDLLTNREGDTGLLSEDEAFELGARIAQARAAPATVQLAGGVGRSTPEQLAAMAGAAPAGDVVEQSFADLARRGIAPGGGGGQSYSVGQTVPAPSPAPPSGTAPPLGGAYAPAPGYRGPAAPPPGQLQSQVMQTFQQGQSDLGGLFSPLPHQGPLPQEIQALNPQTVDVNQANDVLRRVLAPRGVADMVTERTFKPEVGARVLAGLHPKLADKVNTPDDHAFNRARGAAAAAAAGGKTNPIPERANDEEVAKKLRDLLTMQPLPAQTYGE